MRPLKPLPKLPKIPRLDISDMLGDVLNDMFTDMDFDEFEKQFDDFFDQGNYKEVRKKMPHTIYICVPNDESGIEKIFATIGSLGISISPAAKDNRLFCNEPAATTIIAIKASNFKRSVSNIQIMELVEQAINKFTYYGIIIKNSDGSSSWGCGNTPKIPITKNAEVKNAEVKSEPKPTPISKTPRPDPLEDFNYTDLLLKVIEKSVSISDVFFDGISRDDRMLLSRKLKEAVQLKD